MYIPFTPFPYPQRLLSTVTALLIHMYIYEIKAENSHLLIKYIHRKQFLIQTISNTKTHIKQGYKE